MISGDEGAIAHIAQQLEQQNIKHKFLKVSHAFHSSLMEPILPDFRQVAESISYQLPTIDIVSNLTGEVIERLTAEHWVSHVRQPVRFSQSMETLKSQSVLTFLECGPRPTLLTLAQMTLGDPNLSWLASLHPKQQTDRRQILSSLASLYQQGDRINWKQFYQHRKARRLPLPTYPFQRQRHWIDRAIPPTSHRLTNKTKDVHPLLGGAIPTPLKQQIFQQTIASEQPSFLQDHQVQAQVIFSGAAYLEMAVAAGVQRLETQSIQLRNVAITQPLPLTENSVSLQTILSPNSTGESAEVEQQRFEIYSCQDSESSDWTLHCEGTISEGEASPEPRSIKSLKQGLDEARSPKDHYASCQQLGLNYSGNFRSIQSLWRADGKAVGQIRTPESTRDRSDYHLHPATLDACFQCVLAALPSATLTNAYVPIGVDTFSYYRPFSNSQTVWSEVTITSALDAEIITADVQIMDESGEAIAQLSNLSAKRLSALSDRWRKMALSGRVAACTC